MILQSKGIRVDLDFRQEKLGYKIREAQLQKVPYMIIIGDKEVEANAVGVRKKKRRRHRANVTNRFCFKDYRRN